MSITALRPNIPSGRRPAPEYWSFRLAPCKFRTEHDVLAGLMTRACLCSSDHRDAWVTALEDAKLKAWSAMEDRAFQATVEEVRRTTPSLGKEVPIVKGPQRTSGGSPAQKVGSFGNPPSRRNSAKDELLGLQGATKSCCVIS